jgi:aminopeptidase YwaD
MPTSIIYTCLAFAAALNAQPSPAPNTPPAADAAPQPAAAPQSPQSLILEANIIETIKALPTKRSPNADQEHADGLIATEALLIERLKAMGLSPTLESVRWAPPIRPSEENKRPEPREWNNIIVDFPGTGTIIETGIPGNEPTNGVPLREVIVIGAHFDAVPLAPGADDNGSGTAALIELARTLHVMCATGWTHDKTIRLVFFNLEEVGLVGSRHHVAQWVLSHRKALDDAKAPSGPNEAKKDPLEPVTERLTLMLSLECIGFFSDAPNSQQSPFKPIPGVFEPPTVADNIVLVTLAKHQAVSKDLASKMLAAAPTLKIFRADFSPLPLPDLMRSDHAPFMLAGVPSFMVTDTANFRNPNYHKPTDTFETLDTRRLTLVAQGVAGAVWELAGPKPPEAAPAKPEKRPATKP